MATGTMTKTMTVILATRTTAGRTQEVTQTVVMRSLRKIQRVKI